MIPTHTLATDLGSTNFKVALFDSAGVRLSEGSQPLPYLVRTNTRAELDPTAVMECFMACVREALQAVGLPAAAIHRIAFTSQAQTFCVCDEAGGPLGPFLSWTDARAEEEAKFLRDELGSDYHAHTGWPRLAPSHTISMALWWKKNHGLRPTDRIVLLPSFVAMQLGAAHTSDNNLAPMSGFFSNRQRTWWDRALTASGIASSRLGDVVPMGQPVPTSSRSRPDGFSSGLEIVFAGNDHTAGAFGCGCAPQRPVLTLGTAGVLYRLAGPDLGPFSEASLWGPFPGGGYYDLVVISHACSALDWADSFLFGTVDSPRFAARAAQAIPTQNLPFFYPNRWGTDEAWQGEGTPEEKAFSTMEGILFALLHAAGGEAFQPPQEMIVLGGGGRLEFWRQMAADIFRCPLQPGAADGLTGAARLAHCPVPTPPMATNSSCSPRPQQSEFFRTRFSAWRKGLDAV